MPRLFTPTIICLLLFASSSFAQNQTEPYILRSDQTEIRVWTSGPTTYARVKATFPDTSYYVDWGQVTSMNNVFSVDLPGTHSLGISFPEVTELSHVYELGTLASGSYTFNVSSRGAAVKSLQFDRDQSVEHWEALSLTPDQGYVAISSVGGVGFAYIKLHLGDRLYRITDWGKFTRSGNDFSIDVKPEVWTGAPTRDDSLHQTYSLGNTPPGVYSLTVYSRGALFWSHAFNPVNQQIKLANASDEPEFFTRQHYLDFLNREPDSAGLTFWSDSIVAYCPFISSCEEPQRVNVSAAFFLSIEFQETGYLVYRIYKAAYGSLPGAIVPIRFNEFSPDTQKIQKDVVVNQGNWQQQLETNKQAFLSEFVQRSRFVSAYSISITPAQFVDTLFANAGVVPLTTERQVAIDEFAGAPTSADNAARARALRRVAESPALARQEFNRAFVLMEYFGYLRRNPDEGQDRDYTGYDFWLTKLNQFNGDYQKSEMVKAFITSAEYRQRFGPS